MTSRAAVARGCEAITAQSFTTWIVPAQPRTSTRSPTKRNGTLYWRPSNDTGASIPTTRTATTSKGSGRVSGTRQGLSLAGTGLGHTRPRRRADAFVGQCVEPSVGPPLEVGHIGPGLPSRIEGEALIADAALDLALSL